MAAPRGRLLALAALGAAALRTRNATGGKRDLALADVPFNFGITISKVAGLGSGQDWAQQTEAYFKLVHMATQPREASWQAVRSQVQPSAEVWGGLSPDLRAPSAVGCPLHNTPQKWWPRPLAERYFGNKTVFGVLRDPYERLVSFHRDPEFFPGCDVNKAVKDTLRKFVKGGHFAESCRFLPQAEFFDGPFGITVPVDIRRFPESANEVLRQHGYDDVHIAMQDVLRAGGCPDVWAGDLDAETRQLIRIIYKRDFELLCKHFGYCDQEELTCLAQIPGMCPAAHSSGK
mmetsp:Transcript_118366/g.368618  ORF Transcript_118366/g.368618 Transcript_118366/m.368618 type:complete len:289 (+) Transcript_118366:92-958(+)